MPKLALAAVLVFSAMSVACGGSPASDPAPATPDGTENEDDLTKQLSTDLICAAVAAADESNQGSDLRGVPESKLKGDALKDFKAWQKGMVSDYPSSAYELPVKFKGKTYTFWLVVEMNDGGGSQGIYRTTNGMTVVTESGGESDSVEWSAPANKCKS